MQRYADAAARDLENPTPQEGDLAYLQDTRQLLVFNGSLWVVGGNAGVGALRISAPNNQIALHSTDGNAVDQANLNVAGGRLQLRVGAVGAFAGVLFATPDEIIVDDVDLHTQRAGTQTQLTMENTNATHHWRFRILDTGVLQLMSAPIGTLTWTAVDSWAPAP